MKSRLLIPAVFAALLAVDACAETITTNLPACVSEALLDQMTTAIVTKDERGYDYLLNHGCFALKPGTLVSVLSRDTQLHIRAYRGDDAIELWTFVESIDPKDKR